MKRTFAAALACLMLAISLIGCGKKQPASDLQYIQEKGTMVVGMTNYKPMDYKDENGEWIGFDADLGRLVAKELGVEIEFVVLPNWGQKFVELSAKNIDVVWNGMTITDEVKNNSSYTKPYLMNEQVVVMKKDVIDAYPDEESLKDLKFAVENGSAGQAVLDNLGIKDYVTLEDQQAAILEVKAGTSEACLVDITIAKAMTGEGGDFTDLAMGLSLSKEEFGIAFRKGSDVTEKVNAILDKLTADGTMQKLAEKYGVALAD